MFLISFIVMLVKLEFIQYRLKKIFEDDFTERKIELK